MMEVKKPFRETAMTLDSPTQSFVSTGSGAMDIEDKDSGCDSDSEGSAVDLNTPPASSSPSALHLINQTDNLHLASSPSSTATSLQPTTQTPPSTAPEPQTFHPFLRLSLHLQNKIYTLAAPTPRTRFLELHTYNSIDYIPCLRYIPPLPPLFSVCRASRALSVGYEGGEVVSFTRDVTGTVFSFYGRKIDAGGDGSAGGGEEEAGRELGFYLNFSRDILLLPLRFTACCTTTETTRLSTLTDILPAHHLKRIRRVVVSYSARDDYARMGTVLRPYVGLETLYLGMNDAKLRKGVKKTLKAGSPGVGAMAQMVEGIVRETEDEETDDEGEGEDEGRERMAFRARRRIVEVELRLGAWR